MEMGKIFQMKDSMEKLSIIFMLIDLKNLSKMTIKDKSSLEEKFNKTNDSSHQQSFGNR